jgi:hypothetical protein
MEAPMTPQQSLIETEIARLFTEAEQGRKRGRRARSWRTPLAMFLKFVSAISAVVLAAKLQPDFQQAIGIASLSGILLDGIISNHPRLIAAAEAGYAYEFLIDAVWATYNRELNPLKNELQAAVTAKSDTKEIEKKINDLQEGTQKQLAEGILEIKKNQAAQDLRALQALSLDLERAAAQKAKP